jgi:hypothetical protein
MRRTPKKSSDFNRRQWTVESAPCREASEHSTLGGTSRFLRGHRRFGPGKQAFLQRSPRAEKKKTLETGLANYSGRFQNKKISRFSGFMNNRRVGRPRKFSDRELRNVTSLRQTLGLPMQTPPVRYDETLSRSGSDTKNSKV